MNTGGSLLYLCLALALGSLGVSSLSAGSPEPGETTVLDNVDALTGTELKSTREQSRAERVTAPFRGRVASASLLSDELLFEILPTERWASVSYVVDWDSSTPLAGKLPQSIHRTSGTAEDLFGLGTSLIVVSNFNNALTSFQLKNAGANLYVLRAKSTFRALFQEWQRLGNFIDRAALTAHKVDELLREVHAIESLNHSTTSKAAHPRPRALLMQGMFSYGPATIQGDCLRMANFENVLSYDDFEPNPQLNVELLLSLAPDYIFIAGKNQAPRRAQAAELPAGVPWTGIAAYKNERVFVVPSSWMASISHHALRACRAYAELHAQTRQAESL